MSALHARGRVTCTTRPGRARPRLLALESRTVPAVFTVTNTLDAGPGSLRQAVLDANSNPGADVIDATGLSGTISLTTGFIVVNGELAINGPGSGLLTVSGNKQNSIFYISSSSSSVSFTGLTIADGFAASGLEYGGAVECYSQHLAFVDCVLKNNRAGSGTGGSGYGGAVYFNYWLSPTALSTLTATDCVFQDNVAAIAGGAVYFAGSPNKTAMQRCTITGNSAQHAGGVLCGYYLLLDSCTVSANSANGDAAVGAAGGVLVRSQEFSGPLSVTVRNSTISGNSAQLTGGGIFCSGTNGSKVLVQSSTVTGNIAAVTGGGITVGGGVNDLLLQSSVVSMNTSADGPDIRNYQGKVSVANSSVFSMAGFNYHNLGGNRPFGEDPMLAPLQDNGGPTQTHALLPGSPLIDAGANPAGLTTDQRGLARVFNGQADIGAYEVQPPFPTVITAQLNGGAAQRSVVTRLDVAFSEPVTFPSGLAAAFQLNRTGPGGPTGAVNLNLVQSGNVVTATFVPGGTVGTDPGGSLVDGIYTLTVFSSKVQGVLGPLDGNADGMSGDDYVQAGGPASPSKLFRLFGDGDGSGAVDAADYGAFRAAFGGTTGLAFDFDGDGDVDATDFGQFRQRFGSSV